MTQIQTLLERLQGRGFSVHLGDGRVQIRGENIPDEETKALIHELREHREEVRQALGSNDPILPVEAWYPVFTELHRRVIQESKDFDYLWLKDHRQSLYHAIKAKENELDVLRDARLSGVIKIVGQWRRLVLQAEFEQRDYRNRQREVSKQQT